MIISKNIYLEVEISIYFLLNIADFGTVDMVSIIGYNKQWKMN